MAGEIKVVQGNMHRSQVSSHLLRQIQAEHEADLLLMSEQYNNPNTQTWIPDKTGTAAIWVANPGQYRSRKMDYVMDTSGLGAGV